MNAQLSLPLVVSRRVSKAANDRKFQRNSKFESVCSTRLEILAEQIQDADRLRMLEPTSLPKILRGHHQPMRPNTAVISNLLFARMQSRLVAEGYELTEQEARSYFRGEL